MAARTASGPREAILRAISSARGHQLIGGNDFVHQADALRFLGADAIAGEDQLQRFPLAEEARHALRAAVAGNDAQRDLGQSDLRVLRGDADVTGQRQLAAAAEGEAVDRGDDRLREALDAREDPARAPTSPCR